VWRVAVVALLLVIGAWLAIDAFVVTDLERVEAEVVRLVDLARAGGPEAADEILAALADDYRGDGPYARERVAAYVRQYVAEPRIEELSAGTPQPIWKDDEIVIPLLRLRVRARDLEGNLLLRVTFAERDGRFRIVNAESWRLER
jgi:hypothetical protein